MISRIFLFKIPSIGILNKQISFPIVLSTGGKLTFSKESLDHLFSPTLARSAKCRMKREMVHQMSSEIMRVESITEDNMESNCSMTRKYSSKRSEFLRFNLYLCHVISEFCLFSFRNTKISENSDIAKSGVTFCCSGA